MKTTFFGNQKFADLRYCKFSKTKSNIGRIYSVPEDFVRRTFLDLM